MKVTHAIAAGLAFVGVTALASGGGGGGTPARAQGVFGLVEDPPVTAGELEAALSPYGEWLDVPTWGRVWRPDVEVVGEDFAPYLTNGRWLYGAYGWTFNSSYSWGWAAFHFGRWIFLNDQNGWVWTVSATTTNAVATATTMASQAVAWGPAWVNWRTGGGFVGWLPQLPGGVAAAEDPHQYASLWSVVHLRQLQRPDLANHLFSPDQIAYARAGAPPAVGQPVAPQANWRGYPRLRTALAAAAATGGVAGGAMYSPGSNPLLWMGFGSSVHAPADAGHAAGASQLWTGPGSSVFASPGFGSSTTGPQQPRGWMVAPASGRSIFR